MRSVQRAVHITTRAPVVRRLLLLQRGDSCVELRRTESERILRAEPFIADAVIRVFANDSGGVDLDVRTIDETSLVVGARLESIHPPLQALLLGSSNFDGAGIFLTGRWDAGDGYRDGYSMKFGDQDLFGRPYLLAVSAERNPLGDGWAIDASHSFVTDLQPTAWVIRAGSSIDYFTFPTDTSNDQALRLDRRYFDLGGIVRVGRPGHLNLFGASISGDDEQPAQVPVLTTDTEILPDTDATLRGRFQPHRMARVNFLWGMRDIQFTPVHGLDALVATQDLPIGFQWGTQFGRSLSILGSRDNDIFTASDVYVGIGDDNRAFRLQAQGEARHDNDANRWDGILTSGRAAEFVHLAPKETFLTSFEWGGAWHERMPFGVTLWDPLGGVRGFWSSNVDGGQRVVGRAESRWLLGQIRGTGELGVAVFADAGKLWAGDVPFGVTTPVRRSVGVSILGAFPAQSARLWRFDIALAENPEPGGDRIEFRLIGEDATRFFFREPSDVERSRERSVPSSLFRWP